MIKCPFCGTTHVANTLFCSECGTYLLEDDRRGTDPLGTDEIGWVGEEDEESESGGQIKGTGPLSIRLKIGEGGREVEATLNKAIHMGRLDPASDVFPEIDLTNDNGLDDGTPSSVIDFSQRGKHFGEVDGSAPGDAVFVNARGRDVLDVDVVNVLGQSLDGGA